MENPLTIKMARKIISEYAGCDFSEIDICPELPSNCNLYNPPTEPCWYAYVPHNDGICALRSSRIVLMSRATGKIIYDGSAWDEG